MTDAAQLPTTRYTYKPSVAGSPQSFELTGQGLSYQAGFRSAVWRYGDIARLRLSYRPVSMLTHRFRADIQHKDGSKLTIISATWAGILALTPQNDSYRAFVEELHRRVAAERSGVECLAGLPRVHFAIATAMSVVVAVALAGLFLRALLDGQLVAALFMLGMAAWIGWYTGGWLRRNTPQRYEPERAPAQLLP